MSFSKEESSGIMRDKGFTAPSRSIALTGLKHSGKSSVAELLSLRLGMPWEDTDRLICNESGLCSAREVYRSLGEAGFKKMEFRACAALARRAERERIVIATGGGIAENDEALESLSAAADFIYLYETAEVLYQRFMRGGRPAFLPAEGAEEAWRCIYIRRDNTYRQWASLVIDCRGRSPEEVAREACDFISSA